MSDHTNALRGLRQAAHPTLPSATAPNPLPREWQVDRAPANPERGIAAQWTVTFSPEGTPTASWNVTAGDGGVVVLDSHGDVYPRDPAANYLVIRSVLIDADVVQAQWDAQAARGARP